VGILIALGAAALAFAVVALARRGGRPVLENPTRGTPMAIVAGTSTAVLLAFVILAGFQTYDSARAGAATEANAVLDMARTAALRSSLRVCWLSTSSTTGTHRTSVASSRPRCATRWSWRGPSIRR